MNGSNAKIQKIRKISSEALIFFSVIKILLIVYAVGAFLVGCFMIWMSDYFDQKLAGVNLSVEQQIPTAICFEGGLMSGIVDLKHNTESQAAGFGVNLLAIAVVMIAYAVVLHFVAKVFKALKESDSPFRPAVIKNIKIVFVLISIFLALQSGFLAGALVAVSLWGIFMIFEYGCELQQQFDETL